MSRRERDRRVALYRHYDDQGALLYVGISDDAEHRRQRHIADGAPWWRFAVRYEVMLYANRGQAEDAERAAIRAARPLFNVTYNDRGATLRAVKYLIAHDALDLLVPIRGESTTRPRVISSAVRPSREKAPCGPGCDIPGHARPVSYDTRSRCAERRATG